MRVSITDSKKVSLWYILTPKKLDKEGDLFRGDILQEGSESKPYSLSISSTDYKSSNIPGYGCSCKGYRFHRKCKHITELHRLVNEGEIELNVISNAA